MYGVLCEAVLDRAKRARPRAVEYILRAVRRAVLFHKQVLPPLDTSSVARWRKVVT